MKVEFSPVSIAVDVNDLIDKTVELAKGLKTHLGWLKSMPNVARQRLDDVLVEIDKTFVAVDNVVREHLEVALDPSIIGTKPDVILHLAGPTLPMRIKQDRGHCHAIGQIYWQYLKGILDPLLVGNINAQSEIDRIFTHLSNADNDLFDGFEKVGSVLQERAKRALVLQLGNDVEGAQRLVREDVGRLIEMRQHLQDAHLTLVGIRNDFIKAMSPPVPV